MLGVDEVDFAYRADVRYRDLMTLLETGYADDERTITKCLSTIARIQRQALSDQERAHLLTEQFDPQQALEDTKRYERERPLREERQSRRLEEAMIAAKMREQQL
jgi:hypothetical protein